MSYMVRFYVKNIFYNFSKDNVFTLLIQDFFEMKFFIFYFLFGRAGQWCCFLNKWKYSEMVGKIKLMLKSKAFYQGDSDYWFDLWKYFPQKYLTPFELCWSTGRYLLNKIISNIFLRRISETNLSLISICSTDCIIFFRIISFISP